MRNKFLGTGESGYHPIRKINVCLSGLGHAMRYDFSVAYKLVLSLLILSVCFIFLPWFDCLLILAATGLVLIAELINSAIEALCDFIETQENEKIRFIKDISAAAAGISILLWVVILAIESSRLWKAFTSS